MFIDIAEIPMEKLGIYTLANDVVFDQLVALLNSIEKNVSTDVPICVIPFDNNLEKVKQEIEQRDNVSLFNDQESIKRWENFATEIWSKHPKANQTKQFWGKGHHHRFAAFDGEFDKFVFYDADSLAMKPLDKMFDKLNYYDFVFDDWEHRKPKETSALNISLIEESGLFKEEQIRPKLHCSSLFGSKKGIFNEEELGKLKDKLINDNEITWIPRWWDDAFLFNYLTLRCDRPLYNFTLSEDAQDRTGNCADADPFVNVENVLYNEQGLKPIHRIHYMNYSSADFASLTQGYDTNIRYQEEFLYYRFFKNPEQKPKELKKLSIFYKLKNKLKILK